MPDFFTIYKKTSYTIGKSYYLNDNKVNTNYSFSEIDKLLVYSKSLRVAILFSWNRSDKI